MRRGNRYGGSDNILLDDILRKDEITQVMDDSTILYLKVVLSHRYGYNARNLVSHGLCDNFPNWLALRLLHIVLILTLIPVEASK